MSALKKDERALLADAQVLELNPFEVDVQNRIGFHHADKAAALGRLMAVDGQRDPIKVVRGTNNQWRLVTGMHRLMGARAENILIYALEVKGKPDELADLEASENLHRRPLGPIERAKFTAALVQAARDRVAREHGDISPQKLGAKIRWQKVDRGEIRAEQALTDETDDACGTMTQAYGWEQSVGEALGMERSAIYRDLRLFRLLIEPFPDLIEALSKHPVVGENGSQLKAIAAVADQGKRRDVIEALLADNDLSADEARVLCGVDKAKVTGEEAREALKLYSRAKSTLSRMSEMERRSFVEDQVMQESVPVMRQIYERLGERIREKTGKGVS
ncbi:MAG: hypothetical protein ACK5NN_00375 [Sphingomonadaceae bacterium]